MPVQATARSRCSAATRARSLFNARLLITLCLGLLLAVCAKPENDHLEPLRLATTTSTVASGLYDVLLPAFEEHSGIQVQVMAKGTGKALELARQGLADAVLVHARSAEEQFLNEGWGINRRDVMYNDFVLVGPPNGALREMNGSADVLAFLEALARSKAPFLSRGDDSGTHQREMELWSLLEIQAEGDWYSLSERGMLDTLRQASEEQRYTLTDRSTYLFHRAELDLEIVLEGDRRLFNPYGVIAVSPTMHPDTRYRQSMAFIEFLISREGQRLIARYGTDRFTEPLFHPMAIPLEKLADDAQE